MVDYKGPKLIDEEGFPSKNGLNESVSLETLNFDSSSEVFIIFIFY